MEELKNEQTNLSAQPVETEKDLGVSEEEVSLGKFKDVKALIRAYNSLEAEFTKRCQRIKELEGTINSADKATAPTEQIVEAVATTSLGISEEDKKEVLKDYLKSVVASKQTAILIDGEGASLKTPVSKPKTLAEAGALAIEILK